MASASGEVGSLKGRLAELDRQLGYNLRAAREGAVDIAMLTSENAPLLAEKQCLESRLGRLLTIEDREHLLLVTAEQVRGLANSASEGEQRRFLQKVFRSVEIHDGRLVFRLVIESFPPLSVAIPAYYAPRRGHRFNLRIL